MGAMEQKCQLCNRPITRGQTVVVDEKTGAEVHAGCYVYAHGEQEDSDNG